MSVDEMQSMMESMKESFGWEGAMEIDDRQWTYRLRKP